MSKENNPMLHPQGPMEAAKSEPGTTMLRIYVLGPLDIVWEG